MNVKPDVRMIKYNINRAIRKLRTPYRGLLLLMMLRRHLRVKPAERRQIKRRQTPQHTNKAVNIINACNHPINKYILQRNTINERREASRLYIIYYLYIIFYFITLYHIILYYIVLYYYNAQYVKLSLQ